MRLLIVDDEAPARRRLRTLVDAVGGHQVVGEAGDGERALQACERLQPEVVLLDIRMPGLDGLEVAGRLATAARPPAVVFVTAYGDHALEAFERAAVDYLVKPVRRDRLALALGRARRLTRAQLESLREDGLSTAREHILCRRRQGLELIPVASVRFFMADQKYVTVVHAEGEDLIEESLKSLEQEFGERFLRVHRKTLVARDSLVGLERGTDGRCHVLLREGPALEVSRRHLARVREALEDAGG